MKFDIIHIERSLNPSVPPIPPRAMCGWVNEYTITIQSLLDIPLQKDETLCSDCAAHPDFALFHLALVP